MLKEKIMEGIKMCEYCRKTKSLFYDLHSKDVREVVIEQDGELSILSNHFDREEYERNQAIGFSSEESAKMSQFNLNIKINHCPMCGRKLQGGA